MIDVKLIRNNPAFVRENLKRRNDPEKLKLIDRFIEADDTWRSLQTEVNEWRKKRNELSSEIAKRKKQGSDLSHLLMEAQTIQEKTKELNLQVEEHRQGSRTLLMQIPNLLHESVPYGRDENDNVEIRRWGSPPIFDFEPKNHLEVALNLDLIDEERANKVAGRGFYYLKGELVLLDLAIQRFALDFMMKRGYTPIEPLIFQTLRQLCTR
jgi:seryl-tRNA synthetase